MPKIIINGPESSGKTSLAEWLVKMLDAKYIQEYPRLYLEYLDRQYEYDDLHIIAEDVKDLIDELDDNDLWVIDTDVINIKVWYKIVYDEHEEAVMDMQDYSDALHLLCAPDIPWQDDPLRENPEGREDIYAQYLDYYQKSDLNYILVKGQKDQRWNEVLPKVKSWLGSLA